MSRHPGRDFPRHRNNLRLKLGRGRRRYETSIEAYDLYLRARAAPLRENGAAF